MFDVIATYVTDADLFVSDYMSMIGEYLAGGLLVAFIVWTLGMVVHSVYVWFDEWTGVH